MQNQYVFSSPDRLGGRQAGEVSKRGGGGGREEIKKEEEEEM